MNWVIWSEEHGAWWGRGRHGCFGLPEPGICGMADGLSPRLDRVDLRIAHKTSRTFQDDVVMPCPLTRATNPKSVSEIEGTRQRRRPAAGLSVLCGNC